MDYFYRTLLQVNDEDQVLVLSYIDQEVLLALNSNIVLALNLGADNQAWKAIALTWEVVGRVSLSFNDSSNSTNVSPKDIIQNFRNVNIGRNFSGLLQDFIIYSSPFRNTSLPSIATFLPQCYCQGNAILTTNEDCLEENKIAPR